MAPVYQCPYVRQVVRPNQPTNRARAHYRPLVHDLGAARQELRERDAGHALEALRAVLVRLAVAGAVQLAVLLCEVLLAGDHARPQLGLKHARGVVLVLQRRHRLEAVAVAGDDGALGVGEGAVPVLAKVAI